MADMRPASTAPTTPSKQPDYVSVGIALVALATSVFVFAVVRMWPWLFLGLSLLLIAKIVVAARAGRLAVGNIERHLRQLMHVRRRRH